MTNKKGKERSRFPPGMTNKKGKNKGKNKNKGRSKNKGKERGGFPSGMTNKKRKNKGKKQEQRQRNKRIPFGNDKQEKQEQEQEKQRQKSRARKARTTRTARDDAKETSIMATTLVPPPVRRAAPALPLFYNETKYEFLKLLRTRSFSLAIVAFPVMFYVLFGVANRRVYDGNVSIAKSMLGGYACFGTIGAALFGIGVGMASERVMGWLELKRASPMPVTAYLFGKCMTAVAFGLVIVTILMAIGVAFAQVSLTPLEVVKVYGMTAAGAVAFASMGLLLALVVPANAAPGVVNLIYLPMSFMSGLWIPVRYLPHLLQKVAPWLPTYHFAQLMLGVFGYRDTISLTTHWAGLFGFTLLMLGASWAVFHRQENA